MLNSNLGLNNRISIAAEQNDPNCGFQTLKYDFASQHPCTPESLKAARADDPLSATSFEFKVSIATSKEELIQHLDIEASGRAAVWGATVKGSASYMKDLSFTEETIVVAMTARQVTRQSVFDPNQLVLQDDAKLRMEQQDFKGFYLRYGAYVPARITEGATITLFMKRSCSSRTEKQKIAAALGAQGGGYKADASVAKEAAKTLNDHKFEIQAFGKGRAEPIDQDILKMTASEAVKWAFSTWLNSAAEPTAISAELINVWSLRGADPDFESWVEGPTFKKEALTDAIIDVEALKGTCDYILNAGDLTKPAAGVAKEVEAYRLGLGKAKTALKESIRRSDSGMDYPLADDVLDAPLGSQSRESIAARLDAIKSDLAKPILTGKSKFKLRLTGQSVAYIGKKKGKNPQAVTSPGAADVFYI